MQQSKWIIWEQLERCLLSYFTGQLYSCWINLIFGLKPELICFYLLVGTARSAGLCLRWQEFGFISIFLNFLDVAMICSARWHCSVCYSAAVIHEVCHLCNVREVATTSRSRLSFNVPIYLSPGLHWLLDLKRGKMDKEHWNTRSGLEFAVKLDHWRLVKWCFLVFISFHTISTHLKHQNAGLWLNVTNVTAAARSAGTFLVLVRFCAPVTVASEKGLQSQILASQKWYQA